MLFDECSPSAADVIGTLGDDTIDSNKIETEHLLAEFTSTSESENGEETQAGIDELNYTKRNLDKVVDVVEYDEAEPSAKRRKSRK